MLRNGRARRAGPRHRRGGLAATFDLPLFVLLAGDIGGTKTRLALYEETPNALRVVWYATYDSRSATTLEELVVQFLESSGKPPVTAGCFGVAGAVVGGQVRTTNLPWMVS